VRVPSRLVLATGVCLLAPPLLPATLPAPTRALVAWNLGAGLYLALAWTMMLRGSMERMRLRARLEDDGAVAVLVLTLGAAVASVAAIVLELVGCRSLPAASQTPHLVVAGATILISWCFVHTAFAIHYAHEYYVERGGPHRQGLELPGLEPPDYVDFLYFSFVIGTTSQTADVSIASAPCGAWRWCTDRRLPLQHDAARAHGQHRREPDLSRPSAVAARLGRRSTSSCGPDGGAGERDRSGHLRRPRRG
jgi:uncharacterized membrane protein